MVSYIPYLINFHLLNLHTDILDFLQLAFLATEVSEIQILGIIPGLSPLLKLPMHFWVLVQHKKNWYLQNTDETVLTDSFIFILGCGYSYCFLNLISVFIDINSQPPTTLLSCQQYLQQYLLQVFSNFILPLTFSVKLHLTVTVHCGCISSFEFLLLTNTILLQCTSLVTRYKFYFFHI